MKPCPVCAVSVKAENLAGHVAKVHPNAPPAATTWFGKDYRVVISLIAITAIAAIAGIAILAISNKPSPVAAMVIAVPGLLAMIAGLGMFTSKLVLDGDALTLRHTFGLVGKRVALPAKLVHGPSVGSRPTVPGGTEANQAMTEFKKGWYLQIGSIRIGCASADNMRAHWTGWQPGPKRVYADIVIDRKAMVDLEYALAARGDLTSVDAAG